MFGKLSKRSAGLNLGVDISEPGTREHNLRWTANVGWNVQSASISSIRDLRPNTSLWGGQIVAVNQQQQIQSTYIDMTEEIHICHKSDDTTSRIPTHISDEMYMIKG